MKITQETPTVLTLRQRSYFPVVMCLVFFVIGVYLFLNHKDSKSLLIAVFFIVFSLLLIVFLKFITIVIDKITSTISITGAGLLGKKTQTINFNQIKEIAIEEYIATTGAANSTPRNQLNFNLVIYLNDGQSYPIAIDSLSMISVGGIPIGGLGTRNYIIETGNKIASFIGVPFVDRRPPSLRDVVSNISTIIQNNKPQQQPNTTQPTTPVINN
jgi:hypothetical protein